MLSILDSISVPAIFIYERTKDVIKNSAASLILKNKTDLELIIKLVQDQKDNLVFNDVCYINENIYFATFFYSKKYKGYFGFIQLIDILNTTLSKIPFIIELNKEINCILEAAHDDILITDGEGNIIRTCPRFRKFYGVENTEIIGKNVHDLEKKGIFKPSVTLQVLKSKQKITTTQENRDGRKIVVTAVPIKEDNGKISKVFSFSHDITEFLELQEQYRSLEKKVELYSARIQELKNRNTNINAVIGKSKGIQKVIELINKVAKFDTNIFISGETGVGKTMFARIIHSKSNRSGETLVEVNCGAIPESLLESELFGYEKGSFTGAKKEGKIGLIELADKGTLFLDEIGDLPLDLQVKLLKVIQDKTITRVGGTKPIKVDFRLITATNKDLKSLVKQKLFRSDLFYRLNVITIHVPPLKDRKEDIFLLLMHFVRKYNEKYNLNKSLSSAVIDKLCIYEWPGNIRELENITERILLTSDEDIVTEKHLPKEIRYSQDRTYSSLENSTLAVAIEKVEKELITKSYAKYKTTVEVAKNLGISQASASRKIKKYVK